MWLLLRRDVARRRLARAAVMLIVLLPAVLLVARMSGAVDHLLDARAAAAGKGVPGTFVAAWADCTTTSRSAACTNSGSFTTAGGSLRLDGVEFADDRAHVRVGVPVQALLEPRQTDRVYAASGSTAWKAEALSVALAGAAIAFYVLLLGAGGWATVLLLRRRRPR